MRRTKSVVENLDAIVEGPIFDKLSDKIGTGLDKIGSALTDDIAKDFSDLYSKIKSSIVSLGNPDVSMAEKVNDDIILGSEKAPVILIPKQNITSTKYGITKFWAGFDGTVPNSDNSVVSRSNGMYRLYDSIEKFLDDAKKAKASKVNTTEEV